MIMNVTLLCTFTLNYCILFNVKEIVLNNFFIPNVCFKLSIKLKILCSGRVQDETSLNDFTVATNNSNFILLFV